MIMTTMMTMPHPLLITVLLVTAVVVAATMTMKTMMMMPTMPMIPTILFPVLHLVMTPPLLILVPFVMVPIVKMTTMMMTTMTPPLPMPIGDSDDDIMSLSFTNQSLQPHVSASNSSSFIGPSCNLECNAHSKVNRYNIGEDSSDGENEWTSSNKSVLSVLLAAVAPFPPSPVC